MLIMGDHGCFPSYDSAHLTGSLKFSPQHILMTSVVLELVFNKKLKTKTKLSFNRGEAALAESPNPTKSTQVFDCDLPWVLVYLWPPGGRQRPEIQTGLGVLELP